jgi:hypothetical protein
MSDDSFGKLSDTLEPSFLVHSPSWGVTILWRLGTTVSTVGWSFLGLHPIGDSFN